MSTLYTPRPYQDIATDFMLGTPRCALWAGCGLGKTVSTLTALRALDLAGETRPTLVLAPLRVARSTWSDEVGKWDHLSGFPVVPIVGTAVERAQAMRLDAPVYTTNYENLPWLAEQWGDRWPYATVVADEATRLKSVRQSLQHGRKKDGSEGKAYLSGQGGIRARALAQVAHMKVDRFIELTGTPAPNGLADLWGQLWFLDQGKRLGRSYDAFSRRWFSKGYDGWALTPNDYAEKQIHDAIKDICLSIHAEDWFDLEKPIESNVYIDLPIKVRKLYREMEKEMFIQVGDRSAEAFGAAAKTQKCLQLAAGAVYVDPLSDHDEDPRSKEWREVHDEKLQALEDILGEAGGAPVLVAYQFRSDLARLKKAFPKGRALISKKDEDDFKAGKIPILFLHPASAGHGIDGFQKACNIIIFFGHTWNLEHREQIIERIGPVRQAQAGFKRPVFIYNIVARNTVDEDVLERHVSKRAVQDILIEAMKRRG